MQNSKIFNEQQMNSTIIKKSRKLKTDSVGIEHKIIN